MSISSGAQVKITKSAILLKSKVPSIRIIFLGETFSFSDFIS